LFAYASDAVQLRHPVALAPPERTKEWAVEVGRNLRRLGLALASFDTVVWSGIPPFSRSLSTLLPTPFPTSPYDRPIAARTMAEERFTPPAGFGIYRDAAGVPGLLLMTGAFSEGFERACFETTGGIGQARLDGGGRPARTGEWSSSSETFAPTMWATLNLIRDSGLAPWICTPDYVLAWGYPPGASFQLHSGVSAAC
jgi:hypothetical protein